MKFRHYLLVAILWFAFHFPASATVYYVNAGNTSPVAPYTDWATAATNIQDAVDAAFSGGTVLVTNGIYQYGGNKVTYYNGYGSNRVFFGGKYNITRNLTVQSVNGPAVTIIKGYQVPGTTNGNNAVRCVYISQGGTLSGFTLMGGATPLGYDGGGVYCESNSSANTVITNCIITGNVADGDGGGVYSLDFSASYVMLLTCVISNNVSVHNHGGGTVGCNLTNCLLTGNSATWNSGLSGGGGSYASVLVNCTLTGNKASMGGAVYNCSLTNCILSNNLSRAAALSTLVSCVVTNNNGGGVSGNCTLIGCLLSGNFTTNGFGGGASSGCRLKNCLLIGNSAWGTGGADSCSLYNCTVIGNLGTNGTAGVSGGSIYNCIIYYNTNSYFPGIQDNYDGGAINFYNNCMFPTYINSTVVGSSITNEPLFVNLAAGDYHLQSNSPCINAGTSAYISNLNSSVTNDFDGNPRISGGTVDIGAYEFQNPSSVLSYAWAQQYGLPTDGTVDYADPDGDGMNNWQEWRTGTVPTNSTSVLKMATAVVTKNPPGMVVTWQSVSGINYFLQSSADLAGQPAFSTIQSNLVGQAGTTSYADTTATNARPYFYRVGVQ